MTIGWYRGKYFRYNHALLMPMRFADSVKLKNIAAQVITIVYGLYTVKLTFSKLKIMLAIQ